MPLKAAKPEALQLLLSLSSKLAADQTALPHMHEADRGSGNRHKRPHFQSTQPFGGAHVPLDPFTDCMQDCGIVNVSDVPVECSARGQEGAAGPLRRRTCLLHSLGPAALFARMRKVYSVKGSKPAARLARLDQASRYHMHACRVTTAGMRQGRLYWAAHRHAHVLHACSAAPRLSPCKGAACSIDKRALPLTSQQGSAPEWTVCQVAARSRALPWPRLPFLLAGPDSWLRLCPSSRLDTVEASSAASTSDRPAPPARLYSASMVSRERVLPSRAAALRSPALVLLLGSCAPCCSPRARSTWYDVTLAPWQAGASHRRRMAEPVALTSCTPSGSAGGAGLVTASSASMHSSFR